MNAESEDLNAQPAPLDSEKDLLDASTGADEPAPPPARQGHQARRMLINGAESEEIRVAVVEKGVLLEFYFDQASRTSYLGNVYKGRVVNVEPAIGAAFVDFGGDRNGFLHESDIVPGGALGEEGIATPSASGNGEGEARASIESARRPRGRRSVASLVRKGQEVVVQITKDGIGSKGPTLTTNISMPGRYLVLMPRIGRLGVSRRIAAGEERQRLRRLLQDLHPPAGMGYIVRTAGLDRSKAELQKDLRYLLRLWSVIQSRITGLRAPATLYQESDLVTRVIRDVLTPDVDEIVVDTEPAYRKCQDLLAILMPRFQSRVRLYRGRCPLLHEYGVESEIRRTFDKRIELDHGGSILIEQTEALVAIDVNSGKFRDEEDPEETAFKTNLQAIPQIVRQLKLRDLGGVLIIDFIDMQDDRHRRTIERALRAAMKADRARVRIAPMSEFGIIEITRQRVRPGFGRTTVAPCVHCGGTGQTRTAESMAIHVLREIRAALANEDVAEITVTTGPEMAAFLLNAKRREIVSLEDELRRRITVRADRDFRADAYLIQGSRGDGRRAAPQERLP